MRHWRGSALNGTGSPRDTGRGMNGFFLRGWTRFAQDPELLHWLGSAIPAARAAVADPANAHWLRCQGSWFAGVNVLANDTDGAVAGSGPLRGAAVDFLRTALGLTSIAWDRGQISVAYPGYPRQSADESDAAFRYRLNRDSAHLDGLLPVGPNRRRMLREPHGFVLGLPMSDADAGASPMVVWEGSHEVMRAALHTALAAQDPETWADVDVTGAYHAARREVFATCRRVVVHARPGQAYLVHRLALHGVSPWVKGAKAPPEGRMIAYFRPVLPGPIGNWLTEP